MKTLAIIMSLIALLVCLSNAQTDQKPWPYPIPLRTHDGENKDLFVMTLGNVQTPLAEGVYDPLLDEARLLDGSVLRNYFRTTLGVSYFTPIDKTRFPLPPSGWCSWYYYYQEIDENEVRLNARWVASHLKDFGARYVQIDDGWQGTGHGSNANRDWTTIDKRFPGGMDKLAADIKKLGLIPGLWLAPHGQSNRQVVAANKDVFLLKADGSSASDTWEGNFLVDPSTEKTQAYLHDLFQKLTSWGYEYFKIDGQPIVVEQYKKHKDLFKQHQDPVEAYRTTLKSIRETIGESRYLLGCWGIPVEGVGIMNGSRTGGDIVLGWEGFREALSTTMKYYYQHNVAWYCDPDVMLLRSPMSMDQVRAWATLQGLTGQALMASDRMMDLSAERVELLKAVFPAVDIRPLDLFPSQRNKRIWDLKIHQGTRTYDVVGVFNFDETTPEQTALRWHDLGIPDTGAVHVFDFWNKEYLGCWKAGFNVEVAPTSCRVLAIQPATDHVELVSTNRHITQGWVDIVDAEWNQMASAWRGSSRLIAGEPYEIRFAFPRNKNMIVRKASAGSLAMTITNHQGWATVGFTSAKTQTVKWSVKFVPATATYRFPVYKPDTIIVERSGIDGAIARWTPQYYLTAGYNVYLNGQQYVHTPSPTIQLRGLIPAQQNTVEVASAWEDGSESKRRTKVTFVPLELLPGELALAGEEPVRATLGWGTLQKNKSVAGSPLSVGGIRFANGIGTHANSELEYRLYALFDSLTASVGLDDDAGNERGSVEFSVLADGKEVWRSGVMKHGVPAKSFGVNVRQIQSIVLRVTDAGDGIEYDHADWINPTLFRKESR